jgi:hypothetical protein
MHLEGTAGENWVSGSCGAGPEGSVSDLLEEERQLLLEEVDTIGPTPWEILISSFCF